VKLRLNSTILALPLICCIVACTREPSATSEESLRPAYVVELGVNEPKTITWIGEVRAVHRAELGFPVAGRVVFVAVDVGDKVAVGQVLATLDMLPLKSQLLATQNEVARAEAQANEARQRSERVLRAQAAGATSGAEATGVKAELLSAEAALRAASAQRDAANWALEHATLRAPVTGVVASRQIESGHSTGPGAPVLTIDGNGRELSLLMPASQTVKPGQQVMLRNDGSDVQSRVLRVGNRLEAGGVKRVYVSVPDAATVGSTWSVSLTEPENDKAFRIPFRAVLPGTIATNGYVLRVGKDGRTVEQVTVKLGALQDDTIELIEGLTKGDRVIVAGAAGIRPGSLIKPVIYRSEVKS